MSIFLGSFVLVRRWESGVRVGGVFDHHISIFCNSFLSLKNIVLIVCFSLFSGLDFRSIALSAALWLV